MSAFVKKLATSALALGALATATFASTAPAEARHYWGPGLAFGIMGLAAGAIIASEMRPGYYYGSEGDDGCWIVRPVRNHWGHVVGYRRYYAC